MNKMEIAECALIGGLLACSVATWKLAEKIKQSKVFAFVATGVMIGILGSVCNLEIIHQVREGDSHAFLWMVELGSMAMLFNAGMKSNLHQLMGGIKEGGLIALTGFAVTGGLGALASRYGIWGTEVPWTVAFFRASMLTATSVGVGAAIFGELGKMETSFAKRIMAAAVFDDVLSLLGLSICSTLNKGGADNWQLAKEIGLLLVFIVLVPTLGHYGTPYLVKMLRHFRVEGRAIVIFAMMLVYSSAAMFVGLGSIIGAYLAGLSIEEGFFTGMHGQKDEKNPDSERGKIANPIEYFLEIFEAVLTPIFFGYAGMLVDPLTFSAEVLILGGVTVCIAIVGKMTVACVTKEYRLTTGIAMIARGEVQIAAGTTGYALGLIDKTMLSAVMLVVLFTTFLTPFLLPLAIRREEKLASEALVQAGAE